MGNSPKIWDKLPDPEALVAPWAQVANFLHLRDDGTMTAGSSKLTLAVATALGSLVVANAYAVPQPYTDLSTFEADLAAAGLTPVLHNFDNAAVNGTTIDGATIDGITFSNFSINAAGVLPLVSDVSDVAPGNTRSSPNAIGTSNASTTQKFDNGDGFTISFPSTFAVGAWFLTTTPNNLIFPDDFSLAIPGRTPAAGNADLAPPALAQFNGGAGSGGVDGYFVGLIDSVPFEEATITTFAGGGTGLFQFRVDDIYTAQAPAPTTLALLALGAGLLGLQGRLRYR
jgi:hypothetical protein